VTCFETVRSGWQVAPPVPALPSLKEVQVWRARVSRCVGDGWRAILSTGEQERADRFRVAEDRQRFTVTRALLRTILGHYLRVAPQTLRFRYSEAGKPSLAAWPHTEITFNVTHSEDCALLAFGMGLDVGIDVEHLQLERNVVDLAKPLFSPSDYRELLTMTETARKKTFLQVWTRKEALGKALGVGIALPPGAYENAAAGSEWSICDIDVGEEYVAALAARTPSVQVRLWDFQDGACTR
jgi:4'-phosphopantetheinyl transferase